MAATTLQVFYESTGHELVTGVPPKLLDAASYVPLALAYAAVLLLCLQPAKPGKFLSGVAALGQMALSNYLAQSVALSLIFYGYGAGWCGRLGSAVTLALSIAIYLLQIVASAAWLTRYRFGPFEWIWRSLAYGQRQPLCRCIMNVRGGHDQAATAPV